MADMAPIKFEIDQQALSDQIAAAIKRATQSASFSLRAAADELDPGFVRRQEEFHNQRVREAYERGFKAGEESTK